MLKRAKEALKALWAKSKAVAMSAMVAASLTLPALATETGGDSGSGGSTGLASITGAADTVTTLVSRVFTLMTGNPLLCVYLASGLLSVGIYKFVQLRRAAH